MLSSNINIVTHVVMQILCTKYKHCFEKFAFGLYVCLKTSSIAANTLSIGKLPTAEIKHINKIKNLKLFTIKSLGWQGGIPQKR